MNNELFTLEHSMAGKYLEKCDYPWQILPRIGEIITELQKSLPKEYKEVSKGVFIHESTTVSPLSTVIGPCIIGKDCEVRPGAFIRGNALIGDDCVVGNSTEVKNAIIFDGVQIPHYNYVGDCILGYKAHLGGGALISNVKSDKTPVSSYDLEGNRIQTGLEKCGGFLGDYAEVGCHSVVTPGAVIGKNSNVYPLVMVRGYVPKSSILKSGNVLVKKI